MRKFRNAALAIATATTVAVSGISVASAAPGNADDVAVSDSSTLDHIRQGLDPNTSLDWDKGVNARDLLGSDSWKNNPETAANTPLWGKIANGLLIATAVASVFGLLIAPAYNFLRYGLTR